jgi:hypothetical protein
MVEIKTTRVEEGGGSDEGGEGGVVVPSPVLDGR